jgi:hypothetical protein
MTKKLKKSWDGFDPPKWSPDWRYSDDYPDSQDISKKQFAWEFLRRNPDYQKDYDRISDLCVTEGVRDRYQRSLGFNIFPSITENRLTFPFAA